MKWKQVLCAFLAVLLLMNVLTMNQTEASKPDTSGIKVVLDGKQLSFPVPPVIKNGTTYVPFRPLFEALNLKVAWDSEQQAMTGYNDQTSIRLTISDPRSYIDGKERYTMYNTPIMINGSAYIPLRAIGDATNLNVTWDKQKQTIHLDTPFDKTAVWRTKAPYSFVYTNVLPSGSILAIGQVAYPPNGAYYYLLQYSNKGELAWSIPLGEVGPGGVIADKKGNILLTLDKTLYCYQSDGVLKWKKQYENELGDLRLLQDGTTLLAGMGDKLTKLNLGTGEIVWQQQLNSSDIRTQLEDASGTLYVYDDRTLYKLTSSGEIVWESDFQDPLYMPPVLTSDGSILLSTAGSEVHMLSSNGKTLWSKFIGVTFDGGVTQGGTINSPVQDKDGTIYIGGLSQMYAFNPDGTIKWSTPVSHRVMSSALIGQDGTIYVSALDYQVYAFRPDGSVKWKVPVGEGKLHNEPFTPNYYPFESIDLSPVMQFDGEGNLITHTTLSLFRIRPDGTVMNQFPYNGSIATPVIQDNYMYVGDSLGYLYKLSLAGQVDSIFSKKNAAVKPERTYTLKLIRNGKAVSWKPVVRYINGQYLLTTSSLASLSGIGVAYNEKPIPNVTYQGVQTFFHDNNYNIAEAGVLWDKQMLISAPTLAKLLHGELTYSSPTSLTIELK